MSRRRRWVVLLATLAGLVLAPPSATAGSESTACSPSRLSSISPVATPDTAFNDLWTSYGNDNRRTDDWTGGDGTYSVQLPSGRVVWMFSDTFLGAVNSDGSRPVGTPLITTAT